MDAGTLIAIGRHAAWTAVVSCALAGCESEQRIIHYKPFFANIADAKQGTKPVMPEQGYQDPTASTADPVIHNPDGSVTIACKSVRQLMTQVEKTLDDGDDELLMDQIVAEATKEHFRAEGKDPGEISKYLHDHRRDIAVLFARMPMGAHTPSVIQTQTGRNQYKIELDNAARRDSNFSQLWVALEHGKYRLLWVK